MKVNKTYSDEEIDFMLSKGASYDENHSYLLGNDDVPYVLRLCWQSDSNWMARF